MNIEEIKSNVNELMIAANVRRNIFPVPLEPLIKHLDYRVKTFIPEDNMLNISGAVFKNEHLILVNEYDHYLRQRFTVAHEIAHIKLHPTDDFIDYRRTDEYDEKERDADDFAGCLLMPEEEFIKKWLYFDGDIKELSNYFNVSAPSIGVRAAKLGLDQ
jgi:Zn-dependent peptidase ImmA (M78 family)